LDLPPVLSLTIIGSFEGPHHIIMQDQERAIDVPIYDGLCVLEGDKIKDKTP
jgi:hypothetical protein